MANDKLQQLLLALDGRGWLSGEQLSARLDATVSRMTISKAVSQLVDAGYVVDRKHGAGYQLATPYDLVDAASLESVLGLPVFAAAVTGSTNDAAAGWLRNNPSESAAVFSAGFQTAGRGRMQRAWQAEPCDALLCSIAWRFERLPADLPAVSLLVGLSVVQALVALGVPKQDLALKWPNDVLYKGRKLAGVLVEATLQQESVSLVIGVGLNLHAAPSDDLRYPAICLKDGGLALAAQTVLLEFVSRLSGMLPQFADSGFGSFHAAYMESDVVVGQVLPLEDAEVVIDSVDETGALVVNEAGALKRYVSGELSLPWPSY